MKLSSERAHRVIGNHVRFDLSVALLASSKQPNRLHHLLLAVGWNECNWDELDCEDQDNADKSCCPSGSGVGLSKAFLNWDSLDSALREKGRSKLVLVETAVFLNSFAAQLQHSSSQPLGSHRRLGMLPLQPTDVVTSKSSLLASFL